MPHRVRLSVERTDWVQAKFFAPDGSWTFWAIRFINDDLLLGMVDHPEGEFADDDPFGMVHRPSRECGMASVSRMGTSPSGIERDTTFTPCRVSELPALRSEVKP
ncbi:MAG: hypothetical protein WC718_02055 [Phycisphaerales bacterium]